jgi:uncharacterized protein (TIGR04255 family)
MEAWPNLSKAPIVEGLIDIRVAELPREKLASLKACCDELAAEFPAREDLRQIVGQFSISPESGASLKQADTPFGFFLRSADKKWAAQFRLDGFTVSRLEPYTSWHELKNRTEELWSKYYSAAQPNRIVRLATRFINRIPLPAQQPFDTVFKTTFSVSASLPQAVAGFLLRIVLPFSSEGATAIITQALEENKQGCVFDIDVFSDISHAISDEVAWQKLEQLRGVKNRLFFESLTSAVVESFK